MLEESIERDERTAIYGINAMNQSAVNSKNSIVF